MSSGRHLIVCTVFAASYVPSVCADGISVVANAGFVVLDRNTEDVRTGGTVNVWFPVRPSDSNTVAVIIITANLSLYPITENGVSSILAPLTVGIGQYTKDFFGITKSIHTETAVEFGVVYFSSNGAVRFCAMMKAGLHIPVTSFLTIALTSRLGATVEDINIFKRNGMRGLMSAEIGIKYSL